MKQIKRKNAFTLIELLAVIVILAIIALIAVPVVMNIIDRANKSAFKDSAYGIIKAGELFYTNELLEPAGITEDKTFTFPNNTAGLEINGSKPTGGSMIVNKKGQISLAITNGKYCVTKGYEDDDVTITDEVENCELPGYKAGDIVYYNPVEDKVCTNYVEGNSATGVKEGCMKWYVYATDGGNAKLILDHNTTGMVAWISNDDYVDNETCGMGDDWANTCNDQGPKTLEAQLALDTANWKVKADIIELEELLNMLPYYQTLSASEKEAFLSGDEAAINAYWDALDPALNDENMPIGDYDTVELYQEQNEYLATNHSDLVLPSYMYEDILGTCTNAGNETDGYYVECETWGYWTKTAYSPDSYNAWVVNRNGHIDNSGVDYDDYYGLRPVITLSN